MHKDGIGVLATQEQRVAVRLLPGGVFGAEETAGAELAFDHHRLADPLGQGIGELARDDVGRGAGRVRTDDGDGARRIGFLRLRLNGEREQRGENQANHWRPPCPCIISYV